MLNIYTIPVTSFEQNARIIWCDKTLQAVVVDPGGDCDKILSALSSSRLKCEQIWITHSHFDHCGAVRRLKAESGAMLYAHPAEREMRQSVSQYSLMFGFQAGEVEDCPEPDVYLNGGERLQLEEHIFETLHVPGHSPGSICYYSSELESVIVGDVLFAGAIGRTDLPGGSYQQILNSINLMMSSFPAETKVLCGHGRDTSLKKERETNPFLR